MSKKVPNYKGPDGEVLDKAYDTIKVVIDRFTRSLVDGVQLKDYITWYSLARESYDLAKEVFPDGFKEENVIHIAQYIYWEINPDWPLIPEFVEKSLEEKFIVQMLIPMIVNNAWDAVGGYIKAREAEVKGTAEQESKPGKTKDEEDDDEKSWCKDCSLKKCCPCPSCLKDLCPMRIF